MNVLAQYRPLGEPRSGPGLDHPFLGRPPRRQVACRRRTLVRRVTPLSWGEGLGEDRSRLVDLLGELSNGDKVYPHSDNAHLCEPIGRSPAVVKGGTSRRRPIARSRRATSPLPASSPTPHGRSDGRRAARTAGGRRRSPTPVVAVRPADVRLPDAGNPRAARRPAWR